MFLEKEKTLFLSTKVFNKNVSMFLNFIYYSLCQMYSPQMKNGFSAGETSFIGFVQTSNINKASDKRNGFC